MGPWSLLTVLVYIIIFLIVLWSEFIVLRGSSSDEVWHHLGTRTPYRFKYNLDEKRVTFPGCHAYKIWALIRHGTRNPSPKEITNMKTTLPQLTQEIIMQHKNGKGELNKDELELLKHWSTNLDGSEQKLLTEEGDDEMVLMAERMQKRFPGAIIRKYSNDTFRFRYTSTQRAMRSARYFTIGLFGHKLAQEVWYPPARNTEAVLRFYKHCDRWQKLVKNNETTYKEQKLYGKSREMTDSLDEISRRLGLDYRISLENAKLMYNVCGYETAWNKHRISPWCYTLDVPAAQKLEYYDDLKHYWQDGYGYPLTYRQACMSIKDMFEMFSNNNGPQASFLFAHSGTLLKILSHLGLYKPELPLKGDRRQADREWRTTDIDCFASNLAFVLYRCTDGDYVLSLHQERALVLPPCSTELCPLKRLRQYYSESIDNCNLEDMCSLSPTAL